MKEIDIYKDEKTREYARYLYQKSKKGTGAEHIEAQIEFNKFKLNCLMYQLNQYKACDKNEPVYAEYGDDDFFETVQQTMKGIALDIVSTKKYLERCEAVLEYIEKGEFI